MHEIEDLYMHIDDKLFYPFERNCSALQNPNDNFTIDREFPFSWSIPTPRLFLHSPLLLPSSPLSFVGSELAAAGGGDRRDAAGRRDAGRVAQRHGDAAATVGGEARRRPVVFFLFLSFFIFYS